MTSSASELARSSVKVCPPTISAYSLTDFGETIANLDSSVIEKNLIPFFLGSVTPTACVNRGIIVKSL